MPGRDASIPGHGKGKGPAGYKLFGGGKLAFRRQMTQETVGRAGAKTAERSSGVPEAATAAAPERSGERRGKEKSRPGRVGFWRGVGSVGAFGNAARHPGRLFVGGDFLEPLDHAEHDGHGDKADGEEDTPALPDRHGVVPDRAQEDEEVTDSRSGECFSDIRKCFPFALP